jgi:AcrR family transcriptional regulator
VRTVDPEKHEKRKRQILEAAGRCFTRDGFRGASISDICAEAHMSSGHLYHYFSSKEAIISALAGTKLAHATERVKRMLASDDPLGAFIEASIKGRQERPLQTLVLNMMAEAMRNPTLAHILGEHHCHLHAQITLLLQKAQEQGRVDRNLDPGMAASILFCILDGAKTMWVRDPDLDTAKSEAYLKMLITRFLAPGRHMSNPQNDNNLPASPGGVSAHP